jgi:twitching motility protein PilT
MEILCANLRVKDLMVHGESDNKTYYDIIEAGSTLGMQTFDQHILKLYEQGLISEQTALAYCSRRTAVARGLDQLKAARGESTTSITGLKMK